MNVNSPVGEFPFHIDALRLRDGSLIVKGRMGAWPSQIEIGASDVPDFARVLAKPLSLIGGSLALLAVVRALRRSRS